MLVIIVVIVVIVIIAIIEIVMLIPTVVTPQVVSQRCYGHLDFLDKAKDALAKARYLPVTSADLGMLLVQALEACDDQGMIAEISQHSLRQEPRLQISLRMRSWLESEAWIPWSDFRKTSKRNSLPASGTSSRTLAREKLRFWWRELGVPERTEADTQSLESKRRRCE